MFARLPRLWVWVWLLSAICLYPGSPRAGMLSAARTGEKGTVSVAATVEISDDRNLKQSFRESGAEEWRGVELSGARLALKPAVAVTDWVEFYGILGTGGNEISALGYSAGVVNTVYVLDVDLDAAYGVGIKGNVDINADWFLGMDLQMLRARSEAELVKNPLANTIRRVYKSAAFWEYQLSLYAACRTEMITVAAGANYMDMTLRLRDAPGEPDIDLRADSLIGFFIAADIPLEIGTSSRWITSLEATIAADAKKFAAAMKYEF